ncbi:unnamed protein product, partial [Mesorhabditis spiculigera]
MKLLLLLLALTSVATAVIVCSECKKLAQKIIDRHPAGHAECRDWFNDGTTAVCDWPWSFPCIQALKAVDNIVCTDIMLNKTAHDSCEGNLFC